MSSACLGGGRAKFAIPDTYPSGDGNYTLLYSTLGYEAAATKRVLIRQNDPQVPPSQGLAFTWRLVNAKDEQAASGQASYAGTAWGIPVWTADFSRVSAPGDYRLTAESADEHLATGTFRIDRFVLSSATLVPMAIDDAKVRQAPLELDGGYFDGNTREGYAVSHGEYVAGMVQAYERRRNALTDAQRQGMLDAINRGVDYLLLLADPGTGEVRSQSPARPYGGDVTDESTAQTARALAAYASRLRTEEPDQAERTYRRARLADASLAAAASPAYPPALRAAVEYDLYRYSGDAAMLASAVQAVRDLASSYDLRTMDRRSGDQLPHFEAMYRMWRDLPAQQDRAFWEETAKKVAAQYQDMLSKNPFELAPPGVTQAPGGQSAAQQWDDVTTVTPPGEGESTAIANGWYLARAIDATYLAQMTRDTSLERAATASIGWVAGLNAGLPTPRVSGAASSGPLSAASFVTGAGAPAAQPWSVWEWRRASVSATIVGGYSGGFSFGDSEVASTSLGEEGAWLYAMVVYEDYLNAGKRAPTLRPARARSSSPSAHVQSATAAETGGALRVLVIVVDGQGSPLAGANVTGAWSGGELLAGRRREEAVRTTQCVTVAGGSCLLTLAAEVLPVTRPVTLAITNVDAGGRVYDMTADGSSAVTSFP